ncbi:MAG: DUF2262 domain-containing protein [Solobacterium sp.]|nr:DUF2262 domain-containing protein [Solobacterium sp.]
MPVNKSINSEDALARFEASFRPEVKEKLFLVKKEMGYAVNQGRYRLNGTRCIAWVECGSDELHNGAGGIRIMYRPGLFTHKPEFSRLGIYRIRVRENKDNPSDHMIVKVLGKADDPRLAAIREEYQKPVTVETEWGTFELNRDYDEYQGKIQFLSQEISVSLNVNEGSTDAGIQLQRMKEICSDQEKINARLMKYIAEDETLQDWLDEAEAEREGFEQRLGAPFLVIEADGEAAFWFDGGEPFGGHSIIVSIDRSNTCTSIDLAG